MYGFKNELMKIKSQAESGDFKCKSDLFIQNAGKKPVVLYGVGPLSYTIVTRLTEYGIKPVCFCDTYKSGVNAETNLSIITPKQLKNDFPNATVIITSKRYNIEMQSELQNVGFLGDVYSYDDLRYLFSIPFAEFEPYVAGYEWAYNAFPDALSKQVVMDLVSSRLLGTDMIPSENLQYFEPDIFPLTDSEILADGGCFVGDTVEEFIRQTGGKYDYIYSFEPDANLYKKAISSLTPYKNVDVIPLGLWDSVGTHRFTQDAFDASSFNEEGEVVVNTTTLDSFFSDKSHKPTFIKMDIEGAELNALEGAKEIISTNKPKLAISVYHKIEDIYTLPQCILRANPDYRLALRHYTIAQTETVCYAY